MFVSTRGHGSGFSSLNLAPVGRIKVGRVRILKEALRFTSCLKQSRDDSDFPVKVSMFIFATSKVLYEPLTFTLYVGILNKMWEIELQTLGTGTHSMGFNVSCQLLLWHIVRLCII